MVILTGNNIAPEYLYGWISYMWIAPAVVVAFYLGAELMVPNKKKIITGIYAILGVVFEIFLWAMPIGTNGVFVFNPHGEGDLIDSGFNRLNPAFWLIAFFLLSVFVFLIIGMAIKAKQTTGDLRKKFLLIFFAYTIFFVCGIADSLFMPGLYLGIWRGVMVTYPILMYFGLKTKS
jgi:hypothetical protein